MKDMANMNRTDSIIFRCVLIAGALAWLALFALLCAATRWVWLKGSENP